MANGTWAGWIVVAGLMVTARAETNVGSVVQVEDGIAARALAVENDRLRGEVARLEQKLGEQTVSLAEAVAELDLAKSREERAESTAPRRKASGVSVTEVLVLDVNPGLHMAVVDAGRVAGVEPGMTFAVVREGRAVAHLRVVDVRERIAGAVLEKGSSVTPQRGDRAVLAR